jgi:4-amino-4-deoxy-L-arabinose transferase-like glycosyltransferase
MVPLLDGIPFIDKPVLYHWLQAGAESIFGENEFARRCSGPISG